MGLSWQLLRTRAELPQGEERLGDYCLNKNKWRPPVQIRGTQEILGLWPADQSSHPKKALIEQPIGLLILDAAN
jgi:hypothetical protein